MKVKGVVEKGIRQSVKTVERGTRSALQAVDKAVDKAVEVVESAVQDQKLQKGARRVIQTVERGAQRAAKTVQKHVGTATVQQPPNQQQASTFPTAPCEEERDIVVSASLDNVLPCDQKNEFEISSSSTTTITAVAVPPAQVRPATTTPPTTIRDDTTTTYDTKFFTDWINSLKSKLELTLPALQQQTAFIDACSAVQSSHRTKVTAEQLLEKVSQKPGAAAEELAQAKAAVEAATQAHVETETKAWHVAADLLDKQPEFQKLVSSNVDMFDDSDLITLVILQQAGAKRLAAWCQGSEAATTTATTTDPITTQKQLLYFLQQDIPLQRQFLQAGGARDGEYDRAIQLYHQLHPMAADHVVLQRLAMAVALELASPQTLFCSIKNPVQYFIDPHQRYVHYQQAFLLGELDPAFELLTVWELRHVVNSDATDEELGWGRQSLANYRPDICYMDDAQWRYCWIVRTDVAYKTPDWYKQPVSYDQILSGGGKCGPRAWYGRFACKCFGIPTWGVRQPGHAAMTRWTVNGWVTCLGAGFHKSTWEGRGGLDFELETQARNALQHDDGMYSTHVLRLEWIAFLLDEVNTSIVLDCCPSPHGPWSALALLQRKRLVHDCRNNNNSSKSNVVVRGTSRPVLSRNNKVQVMIDASLSGIIVPEPMLVLEDGTMIIPAASTSKPTAQSRQILFPLCFLGGRQLVLQVNSSVEYTLPDPDATTTTTATTTTRSSYQLTLRVCTVHRQEEPLLVTMRSHGRDHQNTDNDDDHNVVTTYTVEMPYTMGMWEETKPVTVVMGGGPSTRGTTLTVARQTKEFAISIKDITLVPV